MPTTIRTVEGSFSGAEGGPEYRVHFEVTHPGYPEQGPSYASGGQPAEGPEWEIVQIDAEEWAPGSKESRWLPIEQTHQKYQIDAIYGWAESLDLSDECVEALADEREYYEEQRAESRADARAEAKWERDVK